MPAPAPAPALTAPQYAESLPMPVFKCTVIRSLSATARMSCSRLAPSSFAYTTTGREAHIPWLPLPETMTTGREQPFILASEPAAAVALARLCTPLPKAESRTLPTFAP